MYTINEKEVKTAMKFDMHCHTKAGSIDSKIPIDRYIRLLQEQGFDGMLVTDHDSYGRGGDWFFERIIHLGIFGLGVRSSFRRYPVLS